MAALSCKHQEWLTKYTFENCKLGRGEYGEFLKSYLAGEHDGFVLNLNGAWGTGKTEFLRRLYSLFISDGHPTIYIDAWESDFSEMPLSVVSSELLNQLSAMNNDIGGELTEVSKFLGKALKGAIIGGAGLLSKHLLADASAGSEMAKALFEKSPIDFLDSVKREHAEQIDAIKSIREELGNLAEVIQTNYVTSLPVIVLVDELDRCRPSYAIEMLEVIKHFFTTKNFVFVVATDTRQLRESIKSVYGSSFDSTTYLKRFFNREARLEEPKLEHYIELSKIDLSAYTGKVILYPDIKKSELNSLNTYLAWVALAYGLSLRDVDQLINKLKACLRSALNSYESSKKNQLVNIFSLIVAIVEFDKEYSQFYDRGDSNPLVEGSFDDITVGPEGAQFRLSQLYEFNMICSVRHEILTDEYGDNNKEFINGASLIVRNKDYKEYNSVLKAALSNMHELFKSNNNYSRSKIWLWRDYQKVVKLAGEID